MAKCSSLSHDLMHTETLATNCQYTICPAITNKAETAGIISGKHSLAGATISGLRALASIHPIFSRNYCGVEVIK